MLSAVGLDGKYQELIEMIVCSCDTQVCMVHQREKCQKKCILSGDLDHDVSFVYKVLQATINFIKNELNLQLQFTAYFPGNYATLKFILQGRLSNRLHMKFPRN